MEPRRRLPHPASALRAYTPQEAITILTAASRQKDCGKSRTLSALFREEVAPGSIASVKRPAALRAIERFLSE